MIKYKLSEVAKDLNVTNKEVADVLKAQLGVVKKPATALTEEELNIVFEHYTQKNKVESFDAYFASAEEKEEPEQAPAEEVQQVSEEKEAEEKQNNPQDAQIEALIQQRTEARKNKDWATADAIRDKLAAMKVVVVDTKDGISWHYAE